MALEKPTRGKPVRESIFIFQEKFIIYSNTQKISNQLISIWKINFCLDLHVEQQKSNSDFFSVFCLNFCAIVRTNCMDPEICAQFFLENCAQKFASKTMMYFLPWDLYCCTEFVTYGLYGPTINDAVPCLDFHPLLLLFPSLKCVPRENGCCCYFFSSLSNAKECLFTWKL